MQRSGRVIEGREPAIHVLDTIHEVAPAGTKPDGKAGRAARRAHVRAIRATRAGHNVGGIEQIVAFDGLVCTGARHNAILHPIEVLDVHIGLVAGGKVPSGPEVKPEIVRIVLCQRRRRHDRADLAWRCIGAGRGLRCRIG